MARERKYKTKEAPDGGTSETSGDSVSNSVDDYSTNGAGSQAETVGAVAMDGDDGAWDGVGIPEVEDTAKGRHFGYVVYPSEAYIRANVPDCTYDGYAGWGTAPDDWIQRLEQTGLSFVVSPLHYLDTVLDASTGELRPKKPHWHVIVSWGNSTTYRTACAIAEMLSAPRPLLLRAPAGLYDYMTHKNQPEKHQYQDRPVAYNGWTKPLDNDEITRIKDELTQIVILTDCQEYVELLLEAETMGAEYKQVAMGQTMYFTAVCNSLRWGPIRVAERYLARTPGLDSETERMLRERIRQLKEKYNTEDMTKEDYRKLLEELVDMEVLSREEAEMQYLYKKMPPCTAMIIPDDGRFYGRDMASSCLSQVQQETAAAEHVLSMIRQGKCQVAPPNALSSVYAFYMNELEYCEKIEGILRQIQANPAGGKES